MRLLFVKQYGDLYFICKCRSDCIFFSNQMMFVDHFAFPPHSILLPVHFRMIQQSYTSYSLHNFSDDVCQCYFGRYNRLSFSDFWQAFELRYHYSTSTCLGIHYSHIDYSLSSKEIVYHIVRRVFNNHHLQSCNSVCLRGKALPPSLQASMNTLPAIVVIILVAKK